MRTSRLLVLFAMAGFVALGVIGCPNAPRPDLVVTTFEVTGIPDIDNQGDVEVPVSVVVENQGEAAARVFKMAVFFSPPGGGTYVMPFTVPGQTDEWYPFTESDLAPGESVTFDGVIVFTTVSNLTLDVVAEADSRDGEEFLPFFGRVLESSETNNFSDPIEIDVP